jgi:hypothetical protein
VVYAPPVCPPRVVVDPCPPTRYYGYRDNYRNDYRYGNHRYDHSRYSHNGRYDRRHCR